MVYLTHHIPDLIFQGGQSRGQHDWVQGFPQPVKSSITFIILSQISCSKVQPPPPPDYLRQLKTKRKIIRAWVHISVGRSNQGNCSEPRRNVYTDFCRKI